MFRHVAIWLLVLCVIFSSVLSQTSPEPEQEAEKTEREREREAKEQAREEAQRQREEALRQREEAQREKEEQQQEAQREKEEQQQEAQREKEEQQKEREAAAEAQKAQREQAQKERQEERKKAAEERKKASAEAQKKREENRKAMAQFIRTLRDAQKNLNKELNKAKRLLRRCAAGPGGKGGKGGKGEKEDSGADVEVTATACTSTADCPADTSTICYQNLCLCAFGDFFSTSQNACVATCTEFDGTYQRIPGGGIQGNNEFTLTGTVEECQAACDGDSQCLNFERQLVTGVCHFHYVEPSAGNWDEVVGWETYQKNCA